MWYIIGILLLITGTLSLTLNELTVQVRRVWPWRRDEADPVNDKRLNEVYRFLVYVSSVVSIEIGLHFTGIELSNIWLRIIVYAVFGAWLLYRRPVMRTKEFWSALPFRGNPPTH